MLVFYSQIEKKKRKGRNLKVSGECTQVRFSKKKKKKNFMHGVISAFYDVRAAVFKSISRVRGSLG